MGSLSSSVNWGENLKTKMKTKLKPFKAFSSRKTQLLEQQYVKYQEVLQRSAEGEALRPDSAMAKFGFFEIGEEDQVDFERMVMFVGKKEIPIERHYAPSLYINFFSSRQQTTLHLILHKLQVNTHGHLRPI